MSDQAVIANLEAALERIDPLTEDEVARALRIISRRAWEATQEHGRICKQLGDVHAVAEERYWEALLQSHNEEPKRRVPHHEAIAKQASIEHANQAHALTLMERSLRKEMEILEKLLSALQTQAKALREVPA